MPSRKTRRKQRGGDIDFDFYDAVFKNDYNKVKEIVEPGLFTRLYKKKVDINKKNEYGNTVLHLVVGADIAKLLLDHGADPNIQNNEGYTPLHYVSHVNIAKLLLDHGANPNIQNNEGYTPLHYVSHVNIAKLLLDHGADLTIRNNEGYTPLYRAVLNNNYNIIELFLERGANPNIKDNNGITLLYITESVKIAQLLLKHGVDFTLKNDNGDTPLHNTKHMVSIDALNLVKFLIENGVNPNTQNKNGKTPLFIASSIRNSILKKVKPHTSARSTEPFIAFLLKNGADPNIQDNNGYTPLFIALHFVEYEIIDLLLENGADTNIRNNKGETPLFMIAATPNSYITINKLLDKDAKPNVQDKNGKTPLFVAAEAKNSQVAEVLLQNNKGGKRSDPNIADNEGYTPLMISSSNNDMFIVRLLLDSIILGSNLNIDAQAKNGDTSLYLAASKGHTKIVEILLHKNASVDDKTKTAISTFKPEIQALLYTIHPLILAVKECNNNALEEILKTMYTTNIQDENGFTALYIAAKLGCTEIVSLLLSYGAIVNDTIKTQIHEFKTDIQQLLLNIPPPSQLNFYKKRYNIVIENDMPMIIIPKGTLLYHGFFNDGTAPIETQTIKLLSGIVPLGTSVDISGNDMTLRGCIDQFSLRYFYSNPAGGPALGSVTQGTFNSFIVYETRREMRVAILMSPSNFHRLVGYHPHKGRCHEIITTKQCECTRKNTSCSYANPYDVCINPMFLHKHNLDGHIAIAQHDSYERKLKRYDKTFTESYTNTNFDTYAKINRILFDGGRSKDIRDINEKITGFPEFVLNLYGTDWFNTKNHIKFEHILALPANHTEEDRVYVLSKFLMDYNDGIVPSLGFQSPLRLVAYSTQKKWYNLLTKKEMDAVQMKTPLDIFYGNILRAYFDKDLSFYYDSRTGFLIHDTVQQPNLIMDDGTIVPFKTIMCGTNTSGNDLENSYEQRLNNTMWDTADKLIPAKSGPNNTNNNNVIDNNIIDVNNNNIIDVNNSNIHQGGRYTRRRKARTTNFITRKNSMMNTIMTKRMNIKMMNTITKKRMNTKIINKDTRYIAPPMTEKIRQKVRYTLSLPSTQPKDKFQMSDKMYAILDLFMSL
jgi:ankyrin repeat protein